MDTTFEINLPCIKYYENFESHHEPPRNRKINYENMFMEKWKVIFENAISDFESRLWTTNQSCSICTTVLDTDSFRNRSLLLTRFRCGSHSLLIEIVDLQTYRVVIMCVRYRHPKYFTLLSCMPINTGIIVEEVLQLN